MIMVGKKAKALIEGEILEIRKDVSDHSIRVQIYDKKLNSFSWVSVDQLVSVENEKIKPV